MNPPKKFVPSAELELKRQTTQPPTFYESFLKAIVVLSPPGFTITQHEAAELYKVFNTSWSGAQPVNVFSEKDPTVFMKSEFARTHSPFLAVIQLTGSLHPDPDTNEPISLKLVTFFSTTGNRDQVMVLTGPITMTSVAGDSAFVPGGDFVPGGNIDLASQDDHVAVMRCVASCRGSDIVSYYPTVCEIHVDHKPKTFFFFKFPRDTYELVKRTPVTLFTTELFLGQTAPVVALRVEFINEQFRMDLYRQFEALRQHAGMRVVFEPPEPVYAEGFLNPLSDREWRQMCELKNQDSWLQVIAPEDVSELSFIQTPVAPQGLTEAMNLAEVHCNHIEAARGDFAAACEEFRQSAPRPGLRIYGCFKDYTCGGRLQLEDGAVFESELRKWVFHLHIAEAFTDWPYHYSQDKTTVSERLEKLRSSFHQILSDDRARPRVLDYYRQRFPGESEESILQKILHDYERDGR